MRHFVRPTVVLLVLCGLTAFARAHFNMLLPASASVKRGEEVVIHYQWGHPFEHQLFDAPAPEQLIVIAPDGKKTDLTKKLRKVDAAAAKGKKVAAHKLSFTPRAFGDFLFVLRTPPIWMEEEKVFLQDTVKAIVHVQTQEGWDGSAGAAFELMPLTRPYGLSPGMVFQAQVVNARKPVAGTLVEIERYNVVAPTALPADEQMTRSAKTDPNGVVTCTLTEAGWWCLTARRSGGTRERDKKEYPVWQRTTLWVFVDEKITAGK
jgi:cobalt/nickel transport protein